MGHLFIFIQLIDKQLISPDRTASLIESAGQIRRSGATGAYSHEFESMEDKIEEVRNILLTSNETSLELDDLEQTVDQLTWVMIICLFLIFILTTIEPM